MKKTTLASEFSRIRKDGGHTLLSVANKCDIAETTVWKIENGRSVRWETVHLCLVVALGILPGTDRYTGIHHLWLSDRQRMAENRTPEFGTKKLSVHAAAAVKEFREMIRPFGKRKTSEIMIALRRMVKR